MPMMRPDDIFQVHHIDTQTVGVGPGFNDPTETPARPTLGAHPPSSDRLAAGWLNDVEIIAFRRKQGAQMFL
jgi:hypothetical protein|tara:strand:- start:356 stop:571 length:216 start_codon:yes stop_codon:yes gene_type:complete